MYKIQGWVEEGNTRISTSGLDSDNVAQGSFPGALVAVYVHGSSPATLATIYSDDNTIPTPLANPFTSNANGSFGFYADSGRFDLVFSGGDLPAPVTLNDVTNGAGGGAGDVVGPVTSTAGHIATFADATGKVLSDGGAIPAGNVTGPASATTGNIPVFNAGSGRIIIDSGISASSLTGLASLIPSICCGRLTLAPGQPVYAPQPATPSSTDTATEVCTFAAAHGWATGTILTIAATIGGLTAGTRYYIRALTTLTCSFYTTLANANADTSRVNLTANVTNQLIPSGITQSSILFTPFNGAGIALYDGVSTWNLLSFSETTLALGTLTSGLPYDVYGYNNGGTLALELLAWTSANVRATAIVLQNGVWVKTGATTRRLLGTIYTDSTTTTIDDAGGIASQVGGKRFVSNVFNSVDQDLRSFDGTTSWTYQIATWRQSNAATGNKVEVVTCLPRMFRAAFQETVQSSAGNVGVLSGINIDSITAQPFTAGQVLGAPTEAEVTNTVTQMVSPGYHFAASMENAANTNATATHLGRTAPIQSGIVGSIAG